MNRRMVGMVGALAGLAALAALATRWRNADPELRDIARDCEKLAARMRGRGPG